MWASAGPSLSSSSPKQWKSDGCVKIYNSVSTKLPRLNPRKKIIESPAMEKARVSVHWRAQCHAKWPRGATALQHSSGFEPKSPDLLWLTLTTKPLVRINYSKKLYMTRRIFATCKLLQLMLSRTGLSYFGIFKLNIKARNEIREFLNANLWSICRCAVQFESEQTPFPLTGRRLRPAALHRIRFGTCCFVPISYAYSETSDWWKDWEKRWALLWFFSFHMKKKSDSSRHEIYKALKRC